MFVEMISDFSSEIPVKKLLEPIIVVYKFQSGLKACTKPIGPILFKFAQNPVLSYNKCRNKVKKMSKNKNQSPIWPEINICSRTFNINSKKTRL